MLDQATARLDGKNAAASTARRNRTILANAMDYALELGLLEMNPIRRIKWTMPKVSSQVDRRSVVNPRQARALLEAVRAQQPSGPRLITFFAVMYYFGEWGGWGSNPGPADYESSTPASCPTWCDLGGRDLTRSWLARFWHVFGMIKLDTTVTCQ